MRTHTQPDSKQTDAIEALFADRGLRCTNQRRALYAALASHKYHPTAEQLYYQVRGRVQGLSLATVYNTLEALCRCGLARKYSGEAGTARYDACVHNHVHTCCQHTGAVHDVPDELSQRLLDCIPAELLEELESELHFKISHVQVQLIGVHEGHQILGG